MGEPWVWEVAVLGPLPTLLSYLPDKEGRAKVGDRVVVPLGGRFATGVVVRASAEASESKFKLRRISSVKDSAMSSEVLGLCLWVAKYYEAPPGESIRLGLPPASNDKYEVYVQIGATEGTGDVALRVLSELQQGAIRKKDLLRLAKVSASELGALQTAGVVTFNRVVAQRGVKVKTREFLEIAVSAKALPPPPEFARKPAKLKLFERLKSERVEFKGTNRSHGRLLLDLGLATLVTEAMTGEGERVGEPLSVPPKLTSEQQFAADSIASSFGGFASFLLHGITGSGKTEVYLAAIAVALSKEQGAIVLVPEISLTPQLASRFRERFGPQVAVLHSGLTPRQRFDEWRRLQQGKARIAVGARSAIFAPVSNLGIIVVDEEHDGSFKQDDGVHYHARSVALVRAKREGAACVLGSASPSVETYFAAERGKHQLLKLTERPTGNVLPSVEVVDLKTYQPDKSSFLSSPLSVAIKDTLERGEQVVLFLNRRGYSTFLFCKSCGSHVECENCAVSLTKHKRQDLFSCHYCGFHEKARQSCKSCGDSEGVIERGVGTEKLEIEIESLFPEAKVARLDRDTSSLKRIESIVSRMRNREIDILIGTQMIAKGHDFPAVTLVGVLCADMGLSLPDFRATEKTFQLLLQVSGRAGRGDRPGKVVVQAYRSSSPAVAMASHHDYEGFYEKELQRREALGYPPYGHTAAIRFDGVSEHAVQQAARGVAARLASSELRLLGPAPAPLSRLRGKYRWHLWLVSADRGSLRRVLVAVRGAEFPGVRVTVDVDPLSAL